MQLIHLLYVVAAQIFTSLQNLAQLQKLHPSLLRHLSNFGLYETVEKNITRKWSFIPTYVFIGYIKKDYT